MVEIPITIVNTEWIEQRKSNGTKVNPRIAFSKHEISGTPDQPCPAFYKNWPLNTIVVDSDTIHYETEIPQGLPIFQIKSIWLLDVDETGEEHLIGYAGVDLPYIGGKIGIRLIVSYEGFPAVDPWENMEQMVQNEVNVLETWKANAEAIDTGIPRLWNKEIYVDQVNGDDENPGTQDAPVASLQKAVNLIPVGGRGEIIFLSDYMLDSDVYVNRKLLFLKLDGKKIITQWYETGNYASIYQFRLANAHISILLSQADESGPLPQILIPQNETGLPVYVSKMSLFYIIELQGIGGISMKMSNKAEGHPVEIHDGALIGGQDWDRLSGVCYLGITGVYNHDVLVGSNAYLIRMGHSTWHFATQPDINFVDENGDPINLASKIYGIIRDDNGIPRNIVSNVVL